MVAIHNSIAHAVMTASPSLLFNPHGYCVVLLTVRITLWGLIHCNYHNHYYAAHQLLISIVHSLLTLPTFQVCAFSTIEYDLTQGPSVTGNYFEVTILILGEKDIGVGLADKSVFTVNSNMPGWINGSYGMHC
jgi:hypothetical protein